MIMSTFSFYSCIYWFTESLFLYFDLVITRPHYLHDNISSIDYYCLCRGVIDNNSYVCIRCKDPFNIDLLFFLYLVGMISFFLGGVWYELFCHLLYLMKRLIILIYYDLVNYFFAVGAADINIVNIGPLS